MSTRLESCIETLASVEAELLTLDRGGAALTEGQQERFRRLQVQRTKLVEERQRLIQRGERIAEIERSTTNSYPGIPTYGIEPGGDTRSLDQHQVSALRSLEGANVS